MKNFKAGIDKVYKSLVAESEVPEVTSDDFVMFLQWLAKRTNEDGEALYTPLNIADVVAEPHHYGKEFTEYQAWRESEFGNSILHPNEGTDGPSSTEEDIAQGEFQEVDKDGDGEADTLIVRIPDMDVEDSISTADRNGSPRPGNYIRIRAQLERFLRDKLGFDIYMGGSLEGKYTLKLFWKDKTGWDKDYFKIVPR
tara:strand:- start:803 stop:1393 length:591 start_codon:yes stop_codon:yes gene_type:complete